MFHVSMGGGGSFSDGGASFLSGVGAPWGGASVLVF